MGKLQSIENALVQINDVVFQELCDSFLLLRNENYKTFSRTGSQSGKQKSIRGTPDSLFLLPNGKYLFVEHTTVSAGQKSKLEKDIKDCLNYEKTGIPINKIDEIILCTNFNLNAQEIESLQNLLEKTNIRLTLYTLDSLSIELLLHHRDLVHQYLNLPLDTGQIVTLDKFIEEYGRASKGIATPLDNLFFHREEELKRLNTALNETDFVIITGVPGVGKTKLAIEAINLYLKKNHNFLAYCISYKSHDLLDDLYQHLNTDKNCLLFIDDANRIDAFSQILGYYKTSRKGALKIIVTVRDYAFQEVGKLCIGFSPQRIDVYKMTDEQIIDIIKSDSFKILNSNYQREIVRIADGNPRIAIMAAILALKEQNIYALTDVSDLFENYFSTFVKDNVEFSKEQNLKCLGLIAFFYTLPFKDKEIISSILNSFNIAYGGFIEVVDSLEKLELVEIQYNHIKVSEQNLATYFFYKTFIKNNLLSFQQLLDNYYYSYSERFKDCIIPANNIFGYHNVIDKIKPDLERHWTSTKNDKGKAYKFLSTFWFYLQDATLEYIYNEVNRLPEPIEAQYNTNYEKNKSSHHNNILDLLANFYRFHTNLKDVLELSIEYTRKVPEYLPDLVRKIDELLVFDVDDIKFSFIRQKILFDLIISKFNESNIIYTKIFYALANSFLKFKFHHTKGERGHKFSWYNYPLPINENTKLIRANIWNTLHDNFINNPTESYNVLIEYSQLTPDVVKEVMEYDLPFVLKIIQNCLSKEIFEHCYYVQEQIRWWQRNSINDESFAYLKQTFIDEKYFILQKIDWNRHRDKEEFEFSDVREYERLKEAEIRSSFVFKSIEDFEIFYNHYVYLKNWKKVRLYGFDKSISLVLDENFNHDFELGLNILNYIIKKNNEIECFPNVVFLYRTLF